MKNVHSVSKIWIDEENNQSNFWQELKI